MAGLEEKLSILLPLGAAGIPALVAWLAVPVVRRLATRWGLLDQPAARKVHEVPTPLGGGLAIWLGTVLPLALGSGVAYALGSTGGESTPNWLPGAVSVHLPGVVEQLPRLWALLGAASVLLLVGLVDDRRGIHWTWRLGIQFAVAGFTVAWQGWRLTAFIDWPPLTWFLSVLWIVALINAFNMLDNMDGLSSGVAAIAGGMLAIALMIGRDPQTGQPQWFVAGLLWVLTGSAIGFLWHNRPPARIFMGDAGSYFLGYILAVSTMLATYTGYEEGRRYAVLTPLCVMAVPLYDMVTVIAIRLREGRSPFHADRNHFSHRLVELGFSKGQAVLVIYLLTFTTGLGALVLPRVDAVGAAIVVVQIVCLLLLIGLLESRSRRVNGSDSGEAPR